MTARIKWLGHALAVVILVALGYHLGVTIEMLGQLAPLANFVVWFVALLSLLSRHDINIHHKLSWAVVFLFLIGLGSFTFLLGHASLLYGAGLGGLAYFLFGPRKIPPDPSGAGRPDIWAEEDSANEFNPSRLGEPDRKLLASWAADCAERVLPCFEAHEPHDDRPRRAIEAARAWARDEISIAEVRAAALAAAAKARAWQSRRLPEHLRSVAFPASDQAARSEC